MEDIIFGPPAARVLLITRGVTGKSSHAMTIARLIVRD
jgi:hypothetical protein